MDSFLICIKKMPPIPKYRISEIIKLYDASKETLGNVNLSNVRKRVFISLVKTYYKFEHFSDIEIVFNQHILPREKTYLAKIRAKHLKKQYQHLVNNLFASVDADHNGFIDIDEFKYALRNIEEIDSELLFDIN